MVSMNHLLENSILGGLPREEKQRLLPYMEAVPLSANDVLYEEGQPVHYSYFPRTAMISFLVGMSDGAMVEVANIGSEGMLGMRAVLGGRRSDGSAIVALSGDCLRVRTDLLAGEFSHRGSLQHRLLHYLRYLLAQTSQSAACNRLHLLEQRFCRWLLTIYKRVKSAEFPITHELISYRLGTPRSEVSITAKVLQQDGFIQYHRGKMRILDAAGLESHVCECHHILNRELEAFAAICAPEEPAVEAPGFALSSGGENLVVSHAK